MSKNRWLTLVWISAWAFVIRGIDLTMMRVNDSCKLLVGESFLFTKILLELLNRITLHS
jgi:hypothetical protein